MPVYRSKPVKQRLIAMMAERFPDFPFTYEWQNTFGFVRQNEGRLYDYLLIGRSFEERCQSGWQGCLDIAPPGRGYNPDWYAWTTGDPWRRTAWQKVSCEAVLYQQDKTAFLDEALERLAENIEQQILPLYESIFPKLPSSELTRWQALAEQILPQLETLSQTDPEGWETLRRWQKAAARSKTLREEPPERMARWQEEIAEIPGFQGEWDRSPILRGHVFNWFTHALGVHP